MREHDLLQQIYAASRGLPPRVRLGPGDDMAAVDVNGRPVLAAVDQLIAGRHHDADTPMAWVGRKAVMRSLSDIAAMAGRPTAALATAALPPGFGAERSMELFEAMRAAADAFDCPLIGGDIAVLPRADDPLVCTVTVIAEPGPAGAITRAGARAGDRVFVTGALGGAFSGPSSPQRRDHLTFDPRIAEALELAETLGPRLHAMIDISDGLGRDAANIAAASNVDIRIDAARIPCRDGLPWRRAAGDGEDYELLFVAEGDVPASLGRGVPVTRVGEVVERDSGSDDEAFVTFMDGPDCVAGDELGWQHAG